MTERTYSWIVAAIFVLVIIVCYAFLIDHQKTECLSEGGKWVSGVVGGNFTYFCIPK